MSTTILTVPVLFLHRNFMRNVQILQSCICLVNFFFSSLAEWASSILYGHLTYGFIWRILLSGNEESMLWYWSAGRCVVWWQLFLSSVNTVLEQNRLCSAALLLLLVYDVDVLQTWMNPQIMCLVEKSCVITVVGIVSILTR